MTRTIRGIFAAAALSTFGVLSTPAPAHDSTTAPANNTPPPVTLSAEQEKILDIARIYYAIGLYGERYSAFHPDMFARAQEHLRDFANKADDDAYELDMTEFDKVMEEITADPDADNNYRLSIVANTLFMMMNDAHTVHNLSFEQIEEDTKILLRGFSKLDAHSTYHFIEEMEAVNNQTVGQFGGVGLNIRVEDDKLIVIEPVAGGPGEKSGILANDVILKIGDRDITGMPISESVELLRGPVNTDVTVTIVRDGQTLAPITLTRAYIEKSPVTHTTMGNDIGYLHLDTFSGNAAREMREAIEEMKTELGDDMRGLILDLRGNGGGLITQAEEIADLFLDSGRIYSIGNGTPSDRVYNAHKGDILNGLPLVVLVDLGSASASELVSGALQDNNRATILGIRTFGKGSVQAVIPLQTGNGYGGAYRITTQLYFTPSGVSIQGVGITPDIRYETEQLRKAFEELGNDPLGAAALEGAIDNPHYVDMSHRTRATCEPAAEGSFDMDQVEEHLRYTDSEGKTGIRTIFACAIQEIRGQSIPGITVTPVVHLPATPVANDNTDSNTDDSAPDSNAQAPQAPNGDQARLITPPRAPQIR